MSKIIANRALCINIVLRGDRSSATQITFIVLYIKILPRPAKRTFHRPLWLAATKPGHSHAFCPVCVRGLPILTWCVQKLNARVFINRTRWALLACAIKFIKLARFACYAIGAVLIRCTVCSAVCACAVAFFTFKCSVFALETRMVTNAIKPRRTRAETLLQWQLLKSSHTNPLLLSMHDLPSSAGTCFPVHLLQFLSVWSVLS